jgi:hypothetical protein
VQLEVIHARLDHASHILRNEDDAHILRGQGFVQGAIGLLGVQNGPTIDASQGEAEDGLRVTNYKNLHCDPTG